MGLTGISIALPELLEILARVQLKMVMFICQCLEILTTSHKYSTSVFTQTASNSLAMLDCKCLHAFCCSVVAKMIFR